MTSPTKRILSAQDAASRLGVHITTIHRWCAAGEFVPKIKLGENRVGFESDDIEQWIAERREQRA